MTSPWPVARFQNNFPSMFLLCLFAKIAKMVLLCWTKWLPELKIEKKNKKKKLLKDKISSWTKMTSEKYLNFFSLMAFWKFQHFNLVSKISQKLFKPLPCHKFQYLTVLEKCCMPSAYLQFHSGERVVAHVPLVYLFYFILFYLFIYFFFFLLNFSQQLFFFGFVSIWQDSSRKLS